MSSSVGRNSLIMASGTAASRVTGQIRTILLAWALGTTGYAANAYQAGSMIPQVIYTLVSGGIFNAVLVPQIVRTLKSKDAETKLNKLITLAITLLLGVTLLMAVATPLLTKLYVNGSAETMALATSFTLWCMPQIFFYGLYTVIGQILAAKDHFVTYAWSSVGVHRDVRQGHGTSAGLLDADENRADRRHLDAWRGVPGAGAVHSFDENRPEIPSEIRRSRHRTAFDGTGRRVEPRHRRRRSDRQHHRHPRGHQRAVQGFGTAAYEPVGRGRQRLVSECVHHLHAAVFADRRVHRHCDLPENIESHRGPQYRRGAQGSELGPA